LLISLIAAHHATAEALARPGDRVVVTRSPAQLAVVSLERPSGPVLAGRGHSDDVPGADPGRPAAGVLHSAEPGRGVAGPDHVELTSGKARAYQTVSIETAALLAPYTIAGYFEAGRDGSWLAQNEPSALEMLTTTGFSDSFSRRSAASVTRMMPTAFVSNTRGASAR
jgi:hypothetical protein